MGSAQAFTPPSAPISRCVGDPDGSLAGQFGDLAIDQANGVVYRNADGATGWIPALTPPRWGLMFADDLGATTSIVAAVGGGAGVTTADAGKPGVVTATATAAGVDGVAFRTTGASGHAYGGGKTRHRWACRIPVLSDGVNNLILRAGTGDVNTYADATDGVYWEYDFGAHANHNWWLCAASNGTRTKTDSGILAVASAAALDILSVEVNAGATSVSGKVNGVAGVAVTTNIPSGPSRTTYTAWALFYKSLGAGALTAIVDWCDYSQIFTSQR